MNLRTFHQDSFFRPYMYLCVWVCDFLTLLRFFNRTLTDLKTLLRSSIKRTTTVTMSMSWHPTGLLTRTFRRPPHHHQKRYRCCWLVVKNTHSLSTCKVPLILRGNGVGCDAVVVAAPSSFSSNDYAPQRMIDAETGLLLLLCRRTS